MELVIVLAVAAVAVYWFVFRKKPEYVAPEAPYKVETPVVPEVATVAVDVAQSEVPVVEAPAVVEKPKAKTAKAPAKPKAKTAKAPAKPKAKTTTKKAKAKPQA